MDKINKQNQWWEKFFSGVCSDVQFESKTEEQTRAEVDFIQKVLQLMPKAKVLDVPCGKGRHSIELSRRGHQVTGVDITLHFLNDAYRKAVEQRLEINWEHRDMSDLPWREEFEGAFCFWGSFGYFDDNGNADFLKAISHVLKRSAKFLLDTHVTETLLPTLFQKRAWKKVDKTLILEERHYNHTTGRTNTEWTFIQEGKEFRKSTSIRLYTCRELSQLFERFGLVDLKYYGSLSGEAFHLGSPRLYLVATKS